MIVLIIVVACIGVIGTLRDMWWASAYVRPLFSLHHMLYYALLYISVVLAFAAIYVVLIMNGFDVLHDTFHRKAQTYWGVLEEALYFSAITLFGVGYGDVTPIGFGRWIAVIQSLIGFTLPATFFMQTLMNNTKKND
ncbi:MAG: ion channel [Bacilli bacterium]